MDAIASKLVEFGVSQTVAELTSASARMASALVLAEQQAQQQAAQSGVPSPWTRGLPGLPPTNPESPAPDALDPIPQPEADPKTEPTDTPAVAVPKSARKKNGGAP